MRRPCARQRQRHDHPHNRVMTKAKPLPPLELLDKLFDYQPDLGVITYKVSVGRKIKAGQRAGTITENGYLAIATTIDKKFYVFKAHRLIWYIMTRKDPCHLQIDHIDGNRLNNKFSNLRLATQMQNARNKAPSKKSKSGLKGAHWKEREQKWFSSITINYKNIHLGYFLTPELAHMAYCKAAAELHGDFARGA
jgi:hypothetical protein